MWGSGTGPREEGGLPDAAVILTKIKWQREKPRVQVTQRSSPGSSRPRTDRASRGLGQLAGSPPPCRSTEPVLWLPPTPPSFRGLSPGRGLSRDLSGAVFCSPGPGVHGQTLYLAVPSLLTVWAPLSPSVPPFSTAATLFLVKNHHHGQLSSPLTLLTWLNPLPTARAQETCCWLALHSPCHHLPLSAPLAAT